MRCLLPLPGREETGLMLKSSYHLTTVFGIPIHLHLSLIALAAMIVLLIGGNPLTGLVLAAGLICSIVLHELGHSLVAIQQGCRVREITLMLIGGVARMDRLPARPMGEFWMALAGPAVSLALAVVGIAGGVFLRHLPLLGWLGEVLIILGVWNGYLACFNLLPALPMDGGRVFRALLARKMGRLKATFIAERVGKIVAVLMGLYGLFHEPHNLILVMIAVFVYQAAGREYRMALMEARMGGGFGYGGDWRRPDVGPSSTPAEDTDVIVSPPPYGRRASRTTVKRER